MYSLQSLNAAAGGLLGSDFITGTGVFSRPQGWKAVRTVDTNAVIAGITGHSSVSGLSYIVGKTLTAPYEGLFLFTDIRLTSGALQAFR
jgi:hypothetical protein